ncbi:MAG: type II toxin-antitoxin system HicB family antitoxin [Armatimonadetes bacterium]|nr:type II toxin-antitoxin system HicB family antitoxin [Armatimonadota bacterium]
MKEYTVIFERGKHSWGAYVPDLPVCAAVAETREEVEKLIREAIELHIEDLRQSGEPIPEPAYFAASITVTA